MSKSYKHIDDEDEARREKFIERRKKHKEKEDAHVHDPKQEERKD